MNPNKRQKIIVAMSGGVDSSVTAWLLKEQGYDIEGLFMKNWEEDDDDEYCAAAEDKEDAQAVCDKLGIPLNTINFSAEYWDHVFEHFLQEYQQGRTPNPDILCNKEIKFKAFLSYATTELKGALMATGHYVRRRQNDLEQYELIKGLDDNKDQSYFLYTLNQYQLAHSIFPVGELTKQQVREHAKQQGFINHDKKDSTGICFIGERKFKDFLQQYLPAQPGEIVTTQGKSIGQHDGLMYYTLGQRQGLKIGGLKGSPEAPWYVVDKDLQHNKLIVAQGDSHPRLFKKQLEAKQLHWSSGNPPEEPFRCKAKIRYRQTEQPCQITDLNENSCKLVFDEPQRAITPGQSVVFYQNEVCLGGGIIQ